MKSRIVSLFVSAVALLTGGMTLAANVAEVGGTEYETLKTAFVAAKSGDTIKLLCDYETVNTDQSLAFPDGAIFDLNGKTLTMSTAYYLIKEATSTKVITIENGTFRGGKGLVSMKNGTLYLTGVTVLDGSNCSLSIGTAAGSGAEAYIADCVFGGENRQYTGIYVNGGSAILDGVTSTVEKPFDEESKMPNSGAVVVGNGGSATILSGTYSSSAYALAVRTGNSGGTIEVKGGAFCGPLLSSSGTLDVKGGTFDNDPSDYVDLNVYYVEEEGMDEYVVLPLGADDAVAMVETPDGDVLYCTTFESALSLLTEDDAVLTLLRDVEMTSAFDVKVNCTLDFGGYAVKGTSGISGYAFTCSTRNVTFEICDGSFTCANCGGFIELSEEGVSATLTELTVENSGGMPEVYVHGGASADVYGCVIGGKSRSVAGLLAGQGSSIVAEDTSVSIPAANTLAYKSSAVAVSHGGSLTINGIGDYVGNKYGAYIWSSGGTIEINGGNFSSLDGPALKVDHQNSTADGATGRGWLTVNAGIITGTVEGLWSYGKSTRIDLKGGTYTDFSVSTDLPETPTQSNHIEISGGLYDADPSKYVKEGFVAVKDATTGLWSIEEKPPYVAKIVNGTNETFYETVEAAIAAAKAGPAKRVIVLEPIAGEVRLVPGVEIAFAAGQDMAKLTFPDPEGYDSGVYKTQTAADGSVKLVLDEELIRPVYASEDPFIVSDAAVTIKVGNPKKGLSYAIAQADELTDEFVPVESTWTSGETLKGGAVLKMERPDTDRKFFRILVRDLHD